MAEDEDDAPALPVTKTKRVTASRKTVVNKLWQAAKRQIDAHEAYLDGLSTGKPTSEADAKALAVLARTVRELVALEAVTMSQESKAVDDAEPADGMRYAADLRKELARRLDALAAEEAGAVVEASSGNGDA